MIKYTLANRRDWEDCIPVEFLRKCAVDMYSAAFKCFAEDVIRKWREACEQSRTTEVHEEG